MLQYRYRPDGPATRRTLEGADQPWSDYSPIIDRPRLTWPDGKRVAVWVAPNVLSWEYAPPADPWLDAHGDAKSCRVVPAPGSVHCSGNQDQQGLQADERDQRREIETADHGQHPAQRSQQRLAQRREQADDRAVGSRRDE